MKSNFKILHKIIAVICSVVILLSAISSIVFNIFALSDIDVWDGTIATKYAGGNGTAEAPYLISTPEQLALMAIGTDYGEKGKNIKGKYYRLTTDIYLNDTDNPNWKENNPNKWLTARRDSKYSFTGHFDGDCHTIRGLYVDGTFARVGLFSSVYGNVSFKNIVISDSSLQLVVGGLDCLNILTLYSLLASESYIIK